MKLVVGLGNPGQKYSGTRHNVGFDVVAKLAKRHFSGRIKSRFNGEIAEINLGGEKVFLTCPLTYMNLSGQFVQSMTDFYKIGPEQTLVICDDFNLPLGQIRIRIKGSAGGQNGLKDIFRRLGTQEVPRLRIGVGPVPERWAPADFVLGKFSPDEKSLLEACLNNAADAVEVWVKDGIGLAMNQFNALGKKTETKNTATNQAESSDSK